MDAGVSLGEGAIADLASQQGDQSTHGSTSLPWEISLCSDLMLCSIP